MTRDRDTWFIFLIFAFFGFVLNALGPVTNLLRTEMGLSYSVAGAHSSAFAAGLLVAGLFASRFARRFGLRVTLRSGFLLLTAFLGAFLLGRNPVMTIGAAFLMGFTGVLMLVAAPAWLSRKHGADAARAMVEANIVAGVFSALAPIVVGGAVRVGLGWRAGMLGAAIFFLAIWPLLDQFRAPRPGSGGAEHYESQPLPRVYWGFWSAIILAVSIEFCMVIWSATYMAERAGLGAAAAAASVAVFLVAMTTGRWVGSMLLSSLRRETLMFAGVGIIIIGFVPFWLVPTAAAMMAGLAVTGFGVANIYPLLLSAAVDSAGEATEEASARASSASALAILLGPLVLGALSDWAGIRAAYSVVPVLAGAIALLILTLRSTVPKEES